jgi:hypothetical protein
VLGEGATGLWDDGLGGTVPEDSVVKPALGLTVSPCLVGPGVTGEGLGVMEVPAGPGVLVEDGYMVLPSLVGPGVVGDGNGVTKPFVGSGTLDGGRVLLTGVGPGDELKLGEGEVSLVGLEVVLVEGLGVEDDTVGPAVMLNDGAKDSTSLVGLSVLDEGATGVSDEGLGGTVPEVPAVKLALGLEVSPSLVGPGVAGEGLVLTEGPDVLEEGAAGVSDEGLGGTVPEVPAVKLALGLEVSPSLVGPGVAGEGLVLTEGPDVLEEGAAGVSDEGLGGTVPEVPEVKLELGLEVSPSLVGPGVAGVGLRVKEMPVGPGVLLEGDIVSPSLVGPGVLDAGAVVGSFGGTVPVEPALGLAVSPSFVGPGVAVEGLDGLLGFAEGEADSLPPPVSNTVPSCVGAGELGVLEEGAAGAWDEGLGRTVVNPTLGLAEGDFGGTFPEFATLGAPVEGGAVRVEGLFTVSSAETPAEGDDEVSADGSRTTTNCSTPVEGVAVNFS